MAEVVSFLVEAGGEIGWGHLARCLAVAGRLKVMGIKSQIWSVDLHPSLVAVAGRAGVECRALGSWRLDEAVGTAGRLPLAMVFDLRRRYSLTELRRFRRLHPQIVLASIDDGEDKRLAMDLVFYPPVPQVGRLEWPGFSGRVYCGWQWIALRDEYADVPSNGSRRRRCRLLVTMGGRDPHLYSAMVIEQIAGLGNGLCDLEVVVGGDYTDRPGLTRVWQRAGLGGRLWQGLTSLGRLMKRADLAVATMGVTAYELVACRTPALLLCLTPDHQDSATELAAAGVAEVIPWSAERRRLARSLSERLAKLLTNRPQRLVMAGRCRGLVDGRGAERIAAAIVGAVSK
ncbi:MAG: hypothetical protein N3A57_01710 [Negativicutes bacterium]|nr:hypothetical protein [Negativicutes bacterium]